MAKRKKRDKVRRVLSQISLTSLPDLTDPTRSLQDRRFYHPLARTRPVLSSLSYRPRLVPPPIKQPPGGRSPSHQIRFANPRALPLCIRRAQRREVLHAKQKTGKAGQRSPVRSALSQISCKG